MGRIISIARDKGLFMSIMSLTELKKLTDITKKQWELAVDKWGQMDKVIFYEEAKEILNITNKSCCVELVMKA
nr:hypothetical protein [uncultured Bacillus sp.]